MPRHIDISVDGVPLAADYYLVQQVYENSPSVEIANGERPGRSGQLLIERKRQSMTVAAEIVIRELYDLAARSRAVEYLAKWADGEILALSSHPGRRLQVRLSSWPTVNEARNPASTIRLEWTAWHVPFWEDETDSSVRDEDTTDFDGTLFVGGTAETPVSFLAVAKEEVTEVTVEAGDRFITLTGLGLSAGDTLALARDRFDSLAIMVKGQSSMSCRTAASSDDLTVSPGPVHVGFGADGEMDIRFSARGRWL